MRANRRNGFIVLIKIGIVCRVEFVLITQSSGSIGNGIVPLDIQAGVAHLLHEFLIQGDVPLRDALLLVDKPAIEPIVFAHLNQLISVREVAVFILCQQHGML